MKYYFINKLGEKQLARTSKTMEYKFALINEDKEILKCSLKREAIEKEFNYRTKGFGHTIYDEVGRKLFTTQFYNPNTLRIVELIKEGGEE